MPRPRGPQWQQSSKLPHEIKEALVWSFWNGRPEVPEDMERFIEAVLSGSSLWGAAQHEEPRWMARLLVRLRDEGYLPSSITKEAIFQAIGHWFGVTSTVVKRRYIGDAHHGRKGGVNRASEDSQIRHRYEVHVRGKLGIPSEPIDLSALNAMGAGELSALSTPSALIGISGWGWKLQKNFFRISEGKWAWGYALVDQTNPTEAEGAVGRILKLIQIKPVPFSFVRTKLEGET